MLALGPALSPVYTSLGGFEGHHLQNDMIGQFGLIDPLGTRTHIGNGISQFVNATLPWWEDPGLYDRVYGFNMHVATPTVSAMLDGPRKEFVRGVQGSLTPTRSKIISATVPAIVCELNSQLDQTMEYYQDLWNQTYIRQSLTVSDPLSAATWTVLDLYQLGMLMPNQSNNTNIVVANWDKS